jgi:hypothetical protein
MRRALSASALLLLAACIAHCGSEPKPRLPSIELRPISSFESALWVGNNAKDDPVVARVDGTPIYLSALKLQLKLAGAGADPQKLLTRLVELELLAREAFKSGKYTFSVVGNAVKKALVLRWLIRNMEEGVGPEDIPPRFVDLAYKQFRGAYDHFDRFLVIDVQILCCHDVYAQNCFADLYEDKKDQQRHLKNCIEYHTEDAKKLHQQLSQAQSVKEFKAIHQVASMDYPNRVLRAQYQTAALINEFDFQYDVSRGYEEQFEKVRYRMLYKEVMDGVRKAYFKAGKKAPFMTEPIRSPIGWHLIFVHEVVPESHRTLADPEVEKEVRDGAFPKWLPIHFAQTAKHLCEEFGCEFFGQRMIPLQDLDDAR